MGIRLQGRQHLAWGLCAALLAAGCASAHGGATANGAATATASSAASLTVGRFASDNPGSVNVYWIQAPQGLVVIDTGRNVTGGRRAVAQIQQTGRPVVAILITHPHPDHVGGMGELHQAFPRAPIYASAATITWMRTDPLKFYELARQADPDYPAHLTYPDTVIAPGATLHLGGLTFQTAEFGPGESQTTTAYYDPDTGSLFGGDLTDDKATPALLEGHTCGWLTNLDLLHARFPGARTVYPGHGAPGPAADQISQQRIYLQRVRTLVRAAVATGSPGGAKVTPAERTSIEAAINSQFPGYPPVASLPNLADVNIAAVAKELTSASATALPAACRS